MKRFSTVTCILATWAAVIVSCGAQSAPSPSPSPPLNDCVNLAYNMMDCVGFLVVGGTETTPQSSCCSRLKTLVEANPDCMCFALNLAVGLGLDLDISRAWTLPSTCGVASPSFATCHVSRFNDGSPVPALEPNPLPSPSTIGGAPATTYGVESAPAPAPSSSSSIVSRPAIFSDLVFTTTVSAVFLFVYA